MENFAQKSSAITTLFLLALVSQAKATPNAIITTATAVRQLGPSEAQKHLAVDIHGVVTYVDPSWGLLFVQDQSAGVFVFLRPARVSGELKPGAAVRVRGTTAPADFAASITGAQIDVIGSGQMPTAAKPSLEDAMSGEYDSQWTQLSGVVRSAEVQGTHLYISLMNAGRRFTFIMSKFPASWPHALADAQVTATGVLATEFNTRRQIIGIRMNVPDASFVRFDRPPVAEPLRLPLSTVGSIGRFFSGGADRIRHVRGTVEASDGAGGLFVSDGADTLEVVPAQKCVAQPGDVLDVAGFPSVVDFRPILDDAVCHIAGHGAFRAPADMPAVQVLQNRPEDQASDTTNQMRVLRLEGVLMRSATASKRYSLLLQSGGQVFTASLNASGVDALPPLEEGSKLRVSGLCLIHYDRFQKAQSFELMLRSPADVVVLSKPSWWNARHTLWLLGLLSLLGAAGLVWLVTLRRRVERQTEIIAEKLRHEANLESRYHRLFETNVASVISFTPEGVLLDCNPAFGRLIGAPVSMLTGQPLTAGIMTPEQLNRFVAGAEQAEAANYTELRLKRFDGEEVITLANGICCETEESRPIIQATLVDVTSQRRFERDLILAKEAAETASRLKGEFLANMSHEIRTPLNGVLGMVSLALSAELPTEVRDYLDTAKDSANHLLVLLNDILDYSKIEAGKLTLEAVPFSVREVLRKGLRSLAVRAHEKDLELLYSVDPSVPQILIGDPHRIQQVLLNLVGNALKFTDCGQIEVTASARRSGDQVCLQVTVKDTGIGISHGAQSRIFEAFMQADGSTTRKYGGTGLGLSICRELVILMGGSIKLDSEPGAGSTFTFTCLLQAAESPVPSVPVAPRAAAGRQALIVTRNGAARVALAHVLRNWGMQTCEARGIADAVSEVRDAAEPAIFLVDAPLLDQPAFDQIRRAAGTLATTVALLDSVGLRENADRCHAGGVSTHLLKPIDEEELFRAVEHACRRSHTPVEVETPAATPLSPVAPDRPKLRVLLAEDNPINQKVACALLKRLGHSVDVVGNGSEAVRQVVENEYDVVLMDVQMPQMDGFEATARIRELPGPKAGMRIIAVTAHAIDGYRQKCMDAGMDEYLTKPISSARLAEVLDTLSVHNQASAPIAG